MPIRDYQQPFSMRSIKNYIAAFFMPFSSNGFGTMLFSTYLTFVYTEYLGVSSAAIAAVVSASVILDGVTDFLMGVVTDRVITRWGKAKHWFLISALPLGISIGLVWMVPESAGQTVKLLYAFVVYNLFCLLCTTVRVPGTSIPALVTDSGRVRSNIAWVITISASLASAMVGWIASCMLQEFGESLTTYRMISAVCAILTLVSMLITGILLEEQRSKEDWIALREEYEREHKGGNGPVLRQIANLLRNRWWFQFVLTNACQSCGIFFIFGVAAYWLLFNQGDTSQMALLLTALNIPNLIGSACYILAARFLTPKRQQVICVFCQMVCAYVMWIAGSKVFGILVAALCIKSFFSGLGAPLDRVWIPMIVDYGERRTGLRQEGLCSAGTSVMSKIVTAVSTASVGFALAANGYEGGSEITQQVRETINFLFFGVPALSMTAAFFLWLIWKLDENTIASCRTESVAEAKKS